MLGVLAGSSLAQSSSDGGHAQRLKFEIWQRGLPECGAHGCSADSATDLSALQQRWMYTRSMPIATLRGGSDGCTGTACEPDAVDLDQLRAELGPEFGAALERNVIDHEADCEASCEHFYCGTPGSDAAPLPAVRTRSYSMGSVSTCHYSSLAAHASRLTPHASRLTPHASRLTPYSSRPTRFPRRTLRRRSGSRST